TPGRRRHLARDGAVAEDQLAAPQHRLGIVDAEPDELLARTFGPGLLDGLTAEESDVGLELAREQQPGLDGVLARREFAAERAVALLQSHRFDRVVAAAADAER